MERICHRAKTIIHNSEQPHPISRACGRVPKSSHIQRKKNRMVQVYESIQKGDARWRKHENEVDGKPKGVCRGR